MSDLTELLERVEKATGPDREIDLELARIFGKLIPWEAINAPDISALPEWYGDRNRLDSQYLPRPTASIDDALALVERKLPGAYGNLQFGIEPASAVLLLERETVLPRGSIMQNTASFTGKGATLPLAVLAALLRALIAQQSGDGK